MMEIIVCKKCRSEIAVDDINNYDVDCDCGEVLKVKDEMKGGLK